MQKEGLDLSRWQSRKHTDNLRKGMEVHTSLESSGHDEQTPPDQTTGSAAEGRLDQ